MPWNDGAAAKLTRATESSNQSSNPVCSAVDDERRPAIARATPTSSVITASRSAASVTASRPSLQSPWCARVRVAKAATSASVTPTAMLPFDHSGNGDERRRGRC
jgi:hypothetical protein